MSSPLSAESEAPDQEDSSTAPISSTVPKRMDDPFSDDEDEDEAIVPRQRKKGTINEDDEIDQELEDLADDVGEDLFGDAEDDEMNKATSRTRTLDDEELNSDDDLYAEGPGQTSKYETVQDLHKEVEIGIHPLPIAEDEEAYLLKIPQFISIASEEFQAENFHFLTPPDPAITAYNYATTAIRWRRSPSNPNQLQSNSRIIKWSDGSMSLQIATSKEMYDLPTNHLFPRTKQYKAADDAFTYIAEPLAAAAVVRFVNHVTQSLAVVPASNTAVNDDIKHLLASRYKAAQRKEIANNQRQLELSYKMEDPEKARREAEKAEKEEARMFRKLQQQKEKEMDVDSPSRRRTGYNRSGRSGLTADALEDDYDDDDRVARRRPNASSRGSRLRQDAEDRREIGRIRNEEYLKDDFTVEDDSELEEGVSSEEEDEEDEERYERRKRKKPSSGKKSSSRRHRREEAEEEEEEEEEAEFTDEDLDDDVLPASPRKNKGQSKKEPSPASDVDAEGDDDDEVQAVAQPDRKKRKVVVDDSDDDE